MFPVTDSFDYEYRGCDLTYGRECISRIGDYLTKHSLVRAMIVCGSNVGANDALMEPVKEGLGDHLVEIFDETTPGKRADTVFEAIDAMRDVEANVIVGVGGGSSLDIARQASVFAADGRSLMDLRAEARDGNVQPLDPNGELKPVIVVPTTFAGADVSAGGSIKLLPASDSPSNQPVTASGSVMPIANFADPSLFETTPKGALAGSAMNGFNKGIETLYARDATPIDNATAIHGLTHLCNSIPKVAGEEDADAEAMDRAVVGMLLVQIDRKASIIHAIGHGFARRYPVQQGAVHAAVTPHVLNYLFSKDYAGRSMVARGLGLDSQSYSETELATAIVESVTEVRNSLDIPARLRNLQDTKKSDLPTVAEFIIQDSLITNMPPNLKPDTGDIESILRDAW